MIETSLAFNRLPHAPSDNYQGWKDTGAATTARMKSSMRYDMNDRTAGPMPVFGRLLDEQTALNAHAYAPANGAAQTDRPDLAYATKSEDEGFNFGDVVDMINPLQHLPLIGTMYRKFTGDTIKPFSQIIGGAVFGGPVGAVSSTVNAIIKDRTGKDFTENAFSLVDIDVTPDASKAPELTYIAPAEDTLAGTTLAVANLSLARDGRHSFSAKAPAPLQRWNI